MQALLDLGASINQADQRSRTPLMWAVSLVQRDKARFIVEQGANFQCKAKGV